MIFCTINAIQLAFFILYDTVDILIKLFATGFINCWLPVLCTKNNLIKNLPVSAHKSWFDVEMIFRKVMIIFLCFYVQPRMCGVESMLITVIPPIPSEVIHIKAFQALPKSIQRLKILISRVV